MTTSFEDIAGHVPESAAALSAFLADRIASSPYAGANKFPLFEKLLLRQLAPTASQGINKFGKSYDRLSN
ncbi:MAG: hypothetical protein NZL89_02220 [Leptospiraceae bacterium]|nr:hypothetical protein [Leptospiraceae bacterium]